MKKIVFIGICLALLGCETRRFESEREVIEYVLDRRNGLQKSVSQNGVDVEVSYRPTDVVLAQQLKGRSNPLERAREKENFNKLVYFTISISRDSREIESGYAGSAIDFARVVSYLSSGIREDIYLLAGQDTIPALNVEYVRTYGAHDRTSLLAVFETNLRMRKGDVVFLLDDSVLGVGRVQLVFDLDRISKVPPLKL